MKSNKYKSKTRSRQIKSGLRKTESRKQTFTKQEKIKRHKEENIPLSTGALKNF
jgi:hypothetical protein